MFIYVFLEAEMSKVFHVLYNYRERNTRQKGMEA